ncbi:RHS repeat-associated core domain-containing protein [Candidatus Electrothrix aarhusensis]|uniref:RHS repeat-associated core domain-containing protein n=1 Tax=Candidatus Electrothrix aarhusensis TaxID=1859131 RepID=A0A444IWY9_9BACT|nr:RHS repeat-associated core domain-containing protein [Candidatus Electrothrix aarhusensis]
MAIVNYYLYEPFGKSLYALEQVDNEFEFVGQLGVRQMGDDLIYMRNRFYAPSTGRFMSEDPIGLAGGDVSFYRYVANDPVSFVDPNGLILASSLVYVGYVYGPTIVAGTIAAAYKIGPYLPVILDFAEGFLPGPPSTPAGVGGAFTSAVIESFLGPCDEDE